MSLYKRARSPFWWIRYYRPDTKETIRISSGTADKDKAAAAENLLRLAHGRATPVERLHSMLDALYGGPEAGLPLAGMFEAYKETEGDKVAAGTLQKRRVECARCVLWISEHWPRVKMMAEVSRDVAFAYAGHLREISPAGKTFNDRLGHLSRVFSALVYRAGLGENVWEVIPKASTKDSKSGRAFTVGEVARLDKAAKAAPHGEEWLGITVVMRYTGLRYGDVATLREEEIAGDFLKLTPSKTERHRVRVVVPLHPKARAVLEGRSVVDGYLFGRQAREHGGGKIRYEYGKILTAAKVVDPAAHLSIHCWRHTFRTRLAEAGVSKAVADQLGGWKTDLGDKVYNSDTSQLEEAIGRLG